MYRPFDGVGCLFRYPPRKPRPLSTRCGGVVRPVASSWDAAGRTGRDQASLRRRPLVYAEPHLVVERSRPRAVDGGQTGQIPPDWREELPSELGGAHTNASIGNSAIAETVIPATPATTPNKARKEAASSSATEDRNVAMAPQSTAVTPRAKPSPTTQNEPMESAPTMIDTAGNREPCSFAFSSQSVEERTPLSAGELRGDGSGHDPPSRG